MPRRYCLAHTSLTRTIGAMAFFKMTRILNNDEVLKRIVMPAARRSDSDLIARTVPI